MINKASLGINLIKSNPFSSLFMSKSIKTTILTFGGTNGKWLIFSKCGHLCGTPGYDKPCCRCGEAKILCDICKQ